MSVTLVRSAAVRSAAAAAACALALAGCDARTDGDAAVAGTSDGATAGAGDAASSGGADRVTFSSGTDRVTFSSGGQGAVTFSSPGGASFASPAAASPDEASTDPDLDAAGNLGEAGDPDAVDFGETPDTVDVPGPGESPAVATGPGGDGTSGTATRGADPRFDFWDGDEVGAPLTSDDYLFRIALYGSEVWLEWFADETREGGSGENCWSPYLTTARLEREGDLFVRNMGDDGATRVEYSHDAGLLVEEMYLRDELQYVERYRPVLEGVAFSDFPVCGDT